MPREFLIPPGIGSAEKYLMSASPGLLYREICGEVAGSLAPLLIIPRYIEIKDTETARDRSAYRREGTDLTGATG
jgi:hypothetical protein